MNLKLEENNSKALEAALRTEMMEKIDHFNRELIKIRTGKAHTSLVEDIKVKYFDKDTPLKQMASLAAPEARLVTIQPWDASTIPAIEKAIQLSDLGLTPVNDGVIIRLQLPEMSSQRREELVKILQKKLEECKVALRNVRKLFNNNVRDAKKNKTISENFFNRLEELIQKITDEYIKQADERAEKKALDLRTV
ncbi:MAG: ribosome recycling factor [Candidatus Babeliales bacterium]